MSLLTDAIAEGVTVTLTPNGKLRLGGDPAAVESWAERIRDNRAAVIRELSATPAQVAELRSLLTDLLWDAPGEIEPEIERTLADDALLESLECYRAAWRQYHALGELPGQPNWRGRKAPSATGELVERWVDGPLPAVFRWPGE